MAMEAGFALELDLEVERHLRGRAKRHISRHRAVLYVGSEVHLVEVLLAASLEIDRLPHAARVAVALLAEEAPAAAGAFGRLVPRAQRDLLRLAPLYVTRDLKLERSVAARMLSESTAVEPRSRIVVARTHHKKHALSLPCCGHRDVATVPADVRLVLHARERAAPGKRNDDRLVELRVICREPLLLHPGVRLVEREAPAAVEVQPLGAFPVRTRMLRKRNFRKGRNGRSR